MKYSFNSRIRYSEIGENQKLTLPALINYFQDCSNFQSEELGLGIEWLKEAKRVWVLAAWQIHVNRYPVMGEHTVISTWAHGFKSFQGMRNFTMEDEKGEMLAYANSIWVYMNLETGRPERIPEEIVERYGLTAEYPAEFGSRKVSIPAEGREEKEGFTVKEYHLDTNHHVNNGQYIQMAQGYLPADFEVQDLRAEYKQQAFLGDRMIPVVNLSDDGYLVTLNNEKGKPYVAIEFK